MRSIIVAFLLSILSACTALTPPKERPVIEDKVKNVGLLTVTPERRAILIKENKDLDVYCAEPSPDVAEGITSTLRAVAEAAVKDGKGKSIEASAEIAKNFSSAISTLFVRSQGIQLFRDGSYALCQAYQNRAITSDQFKAMFETLLTTSSKLVDNELPQLKELKQLNLLQQTQNARDESNKNAAQSHQSAEEAKNSATKAEDAAKKLEKTSKNTEEKESK